MTRGALLIAGIALGGTGVVSWGFPGPARSRAELVFRGALALLFGMGLTSAASGALWLAAGISWPAHAAMTFLGATLLATAARRRRTSPGGAHASLDGAHASPDGAHRPPGAARSWSGAARPAPPELSIAFAVAATLVLSLFVEHSLRYPDGGWDALAIWNLRARSLWLGTPATAFAAELALDHPGYPLLLPQLVADGLRSGAGAWAHIAPAIAFAALCVALLASAAAMLRGPRTGLAAGLALLGTPALLQLGVTQCADVPVAASLLAACALAALFTDRRALALAGCAASLAAWTKNEAILHGALLVLALLWARRPLKPFLLGALPVVLLLLWFKLRFALANDLAAATTAAGVLRKVADVHRWLAIAGALVSRVWKFELWGLAAPAAVLLLIARWRAADRLLLHALLLFATAIVAIYLATPVNLVEHLGSSLDRLLFQLAPVVLLAAASSLTLPRVAQRS